MAPFILTGATSLINKNDDNRNKMVFQHILKDVFQQHQSQPLAPTSPLLEIKRRFQWTLITQNRQLPIETTNFSTNKTAFEPKLIKLSPTSSVLGSSTTSHAPRPLLKSPSSSPNESSGPLIVNSLPIHSHSDTFCLNDTFLLDGGEHFFGVDLLCLKFCAGRLTIIMSRKNIRTCWMEFKSLKSCFVVVTNSYDADHGFIMESINVKADWIGIHQRNRLALLPSSSTSVKLTQSMKNICSDLVSWRKKDDGDTITDYDRVFIAQDPFHPDQSFPIVDFTSSCHVESDSFILSPSISSTSTCSSSTSCTFLSPPGSPLFNATTLPLYDNDDELDEYEGQCQSFSNASLMALIQETLQYIHSSPSQHSYSTELESLVPKMDSFLSHSL